MRLHVHEWGDPDAPAVVCLHGVTAHGARFRRLAQEALGDYHVVAPDLRGHGRSDWEPPWSIAQVLDDVLETTEALGIGPCRWIGHSYGGRLTLELSARAPERVERAVLLDPAIQVLPHVGLDQAESYREDLSFGSPEEAIAARLEGGWPTPRSALEEEMGEHLVQRRDGRWEYRFCPSAAITFYSDMTSDPPAPETLAMPALLVYAPQFGLVREEQVEALRPHAEVVPVPGGHIVYWDAFDETAAAVRRFFLA
jgi:lipase